MASVYLCCMPSIAKLFQHYNIFLYYNGIVKFLDYNTSPYLMFW